jgi:hypothetical protein
MTPESVANLRDRCLSYETRSEVQLKDPALYHRVRRAGLQDVCFAHMPILRRRWDIEELVKEARKYTTRTEMLAANPGLYMCLTRRGLHHLLPPSRRGKKQ